MFEELLDKLNGESEQLLHELNVVLPAQIETAVALGDLRENSEYSAALERQQFVGARLEYLSRRLSEISQIDVETISRDLVGFGSRVQLLDLEDQTTESYTLAFGDLIDFDKGEISMASPIGKALLGKVPGDEVNVALPGGQRRYRLQALTTLHEMTNSTSPDSGDGPRKR